MIQEGSKAIRIAGAGQQIGDHGVDVAAFRLVSQLSP